MRQIAEWFIASPWGKKGASIIGGFCAGVWFMSVYHKQVLDTLDVWGVSRGEFLKAMIAVAGASGIALSVGLSVVKQNRDNEEAKP